MFRLVARTPANNKEVISTLDRIVISLNFKQTTKPPFSFGSETVRWPIKKSGTIASATNEFVRSTPPGSGQMTSTVIFENRQLRFFFLTHFRFLVISLLLHHPFARWSCFLKSQCFYRVVHSSLPALNNGGAFAQLLSPAKWIELNRRTLVYG